jgi:hypothetical protein
VAGTLLLGRKTYEGFKGFWPGVADDPTAAAQQLGVPVEYLDTPANREISRLENAIDKLVVRIAELKRGAGARHRLDRPTRQPENGAPWASAQPASRSTTSGRSR